MASCSHWSWTAPPKSMPCTRKRWNWALPTKAHPDRAARAFTPVTSAIWMATSSTRFSWGERARHLVSRTRLVGGSGRQDGIELEQHGLLVPVADAEYL